MLKVFLVEDESSIRENLRDNIMWQQYGYQFAGEAGDGEMALPLIRKVKPDVLITDINMPFMDGLALAGIVKREFPQIKIIIVSIHNDFECAQRAIAAGVERYLLKPISRSALNLRKTCRNMSSFPEESFLRRCLRVIFRYGKFMSRRRNFHLRWMRQVIILLW